MSVNFEGNASVREEAIAVALERTPEARVPVDFAERVARAAVAQRVPARSPWSGFGARAALGSTAVLLVALFAYAPHGSSGFLDLRFDVELLLLAELGGVAWIAARAGLGE